MIDTREVLRREEKLTTLRRVARRPSRTQNWRVLELASPEFHVAVPSPPRASRANFLLARASRAKRASRSRRARLTAEGSRSFRGFQFQNRARDRSIATRFSKTTARLAEGRRSAAKSRDVDRNS
jgi:hypothetical protein